MKRTSIFVLLLSFALCSQAQEKMKKNDRPKEDKDNSGDNRSADDDVSFWKKIRVGGNVGATFGTITYLQATPIVGYAVSDKFLVGVSGTYIYQSYRDNTGKYAFNIYGGSLLARYHIIENGFLTAELEQLNTGVPVSNTKDRRIWINGTLVGAGYAPSFDSFRGPYFIVLYNLTSSYYSPYGSPLVFRVGMLF